MSSPAATNTTTTTTTQNNRRTSKRPSSKLLSQIKSKQSKLREQLASTPQDDDEADMIASQAQLDLESSEKRDREAQQQRYNSNTKELFAKIKGAEKWIMMIAPSYQKLIEEIHLMLEQANGGQDTSKKQILLTAQRAKMEIRNQEDFVKLRDNGEMVIIEIRDE